MTDKKGEGEGGPAPQPPISAVSRAVAVAHESPCRSKRGVVIFRGDTPIARGFNDKPFGFNCDGSEACKATCRTEAVHAEQVALLRAGLLARGADLLHVKVDAHGSAVFSGGPSCVQCSKLIVAAGIAGVWLNHESGWRRYPAHEFHALSVDESRANPARFTPLEQGNTLGSALPSSSLSVQLHAQDEAIARLTAERDAPFGWTARSNSQVQWWKDEGGAIIVRHTAFSTAADAEKFTNVIKELQRLFRRGDRPHDEPRDEANACVGCGGSEFELVRHCKSCGCAKAEPNPVPICMFWTDGGQMCSRCEKCQQRPLSGQADAAREDTMKLEGTIDGRCGCEKCRARTENVYRQVSGKCRNCGAGPFLILYREGDPAASQDCPRCRGGYKPVSAERPATDDESPGTADAAREAPAWMRLPFHGMRVPPTGPYVLLADLQSTVMGSEDAAREARRAAPPCPKCRHAWHDAACSEPVAPGEVSAFPMTCGCQEHEDREDREAGLVSSQPAEPDRDAAARFDSQLQGYADGRAIRPPTTD
jgi:deoxycytidylate deaminase